ncbi:MAG: c-type cytochrome [Candidatus Neomarinimicrobiota bacterium]
MHVKNKFKRPSGKLSFWFITILVFSMQAIVVAQSDTESRSQYLGKTVFEEKGCEQCHTVFGKGGKGGPDLGEHKFYGTYLELTATMWNHFPKMSKKMRKSKQQFPKFNETEMLQIVDYLSFVRYRGEPGNVFRGRKLLKSRSCTACHKFGGEGGDIGPDISAKQEYISPLQLVEAMWNHGPDMMELFEENDIKRPEFKGNDIVHLSAAIQSHMSPTKVPVNSYSIGDCDNGEMLIEEKGCLHCHSVQGTGGTIGPDFNDVYFNYSVLVIAGKMWNHGPKMWEAMKLENIPIPVFKRGEMCDIIAYMYRLNLEDAPGDIGKGKQIIVEKNCVSCHSINKEYSDLAKDFTAIQSPNSPMAMIAAMWNHAPAMEEQRAAARLRWPELNGRDMANIYAYFQSLQPE